MVPPALEGTGDVPVGPASQRSCSDSPPPLVLHSAGAEQVGIIGSYCVDNAQLGCGVCVDRIMSPNDSFTVAHPGDELTIAMPGARLVAHPRCTPACSLEVVIARATCFQGSLLPEDRLGFPEGVAQRTVIAQDQPWTLAVAPGLYFLSVNGGEFSAPDGFSGEASGTFGLLVDPDRERTSLDAAPFYADCRASSLPDAGGNGAGGDADGAAAPDGG